jgi:hypothetical protein
MAKVAKDPHQSDCPCFGDTTSDGKQVVHAKNCANCTCPKGRACEDCGDEMKPGERRFTCPDCSKKICGWCWNHVHGIPFQGVNP